LCLASIIGCAAMALFGVCSPAEAFAGFGSDTVLLVLGMVTLGNALFETGAAQVLGRTMIKIGRGKEKVLMGLTTSFACGISSFMSNSATVAMFMSIFNAVEVSNPKLDRRDFIMAAGVAATVGGGMTLVASTSQVVAQGILLQTLGYGFSFWDFTKVCFPIAVLMVFYYTFINLKRGKKIWGDREREDKDEAAMQEAAASLNKEYDNKKVVLVFVIFGLTIVGFIGSWLSVGLTCILAAIVCLLTKTISQKRAFEKMDWNTIGILGASIGIATGLDKGGGGQLIADGFVNLVGYDAAPLVLFVGICVIGGVMTQFMSNTATVGVLTPIVLSICANLDLNYLTFIMGIIFASKMSFSTPVATTPLTMTLAAGYKFNDYWRYNLLFNVVALTIAIALTAWLLPLTQ
jgi:anion transporter